MRYKILYIFFLISSFCFGQTSDERSVKDVINSLFTAMNNTDSETVKTLFTDQAIMQTISRDGSVKTDDVKEFILSFSKFSKNDLDERIVFKNISIDGDLASVFTPYSFYFKGKFSHCGANSFQLIRQNGIWKIHYLIDTRRKENCKEILK
ncbi:MULTISPECIES: nuclear transport factor 2 family protein [Chryseobacterium]|uniref:Lumazine-binding n=1 Tax=Chryseobacterium taihuense TaxID=1141221 RepID=A0A1G9LWX1_9FLAO|nr:MULTISPECIES: nuclear transport factor 2 family protein [Chryseobacterium]QQV01570.1 nuclear transport factor 2 family protein [Chryseobacterium sp. FDAARGOS 1104]SDL66458.1 protein of unknown function [Chryseobacterium taihuense]VFB05234.1 Putative lumazine-binding [Chryseobacterium taihuense]